MKVMLKNTSYALAFALMAPALVSTASAIDLEKAHHTAIQNCVNWNGLSNEYCKCVQEKIRADLPNESYSAMLQFAQAYEENRRADLAAMQVDAKLSTALEPVDAVVSAAESACKS
ncbi:MAG: hypothetical protein ACR2QF_15305 [Geminicoccaceae bacterium]